MNTALIVIPLTAAAAGLLGGFILRVRADKLGRAGSEPVTRHRRPTFWHRFTGRSEVWATARGAIDEVMTTLASPAVPYELKPADTTALGRHNPAHPQAIGSLVQRRLGDTMRIPPYIDEVPVGERA